MNSIMILLFVLLACGLYSFILKPSIFTFLMLILQYFYGRKFILYEISRIYSILNIIRTSHREWMNKFIGLAFYVIGINIFGISKKLSLTGEIWIFLFTILTVLFLVIGAFIRSFEILGNLNNSDPRIYKYLALGTKFIIISVVILLLLTDSQKLDTHASIIGAMYLFSEMVYVEYKVLADSLPEKEVEIDED